MNQFGTQKLYTDIPYLKACDKFSQSGFDARFYTSTELAIYDVIQSLIQHMPHKNKIAVIARGSHLLDTVTAVALKNQNQIVYKKETESTMAFLETLDAGTHCVYWVAEHEITGEVYYSKKEYTEILSILNRKKIFSVQVTSSLIPQVLNEITANETSSYSLIINTPNIFEYRTHPTMLFYSDKQKIQFMLSLLQNNLELNAFISNPEYNFTKSASHIQYTDQLIDRTVVTTERATAQAVKEFLNLPPDEAFVATDYPSWMTDKWVTWWPELEKTQVLKNTLILSKKFTDKNPDHMMQINRAEAKIAELSQWKA